MWRHSNDMTQCIANILCKVIISSEADRRHAIAWTDADLLSHEKKSVHATDLR